MRALTGYLPHMSSDAPALHLHVSMTGAMTSIAARREVRRLLHDRAGTAELDAVLLATSELLNNALAYNGGRCELSVWYPWTPSIVRVEVADSGRTLPTMPAVPSPSQLSGRGLNIVDTLVDRWGAEPRPEGKIVWFEIDEPHPGDSSRP